MRRFGPTRILFGLALSLLAGSGEAKTLRVRIVDMAFDPADLSLSVGDVIEWKNEDFIDHTATDRGGAFDVTIAAGAVATVGIERAGFYAYLCRFHPTMTGKITAR